MTDQATRNKPNKILAIVLMLASILLVLWVFNSLKVSHTIEFLELKTVDLRFNSQLIESPNKPSDDIVIIAFDDVTLASYGEEYGTWPWPRKIHAEMITFLNEVAEVKTIAYDLVFSTPEKGKGTSDDAFVKAFKHYDNVILSTNFDRQDHYEHNNDKQLEANKLNTSDFSCFHQSHLIFSSFRPLLSELMNANKNLAFINHQPDIDGVSRSNSLFYFYEPEESSNIAQIGVYPYLSFKLYLDLLNSQSKTIETSSEGDLRVNGNDIPLSSNGNFMIHWYNMDFDNEAASEYINKKQQFKKEIQQDTSIPADVKQTQLAQIKQEVEQRQSIINNQSRNINPYQVVSAGDVLEAIRHKTDNTLDKHDRNLIRLLKNKTVFIGATAVATYDNKITPLHPQGTSGILIPATIFDNLKQGHFIKRVDYNINLFVTVILALLCALAATRLRSATVGLLVIVAIGTVYVLLATLLFIQQGVWLNIAMPIFVMTITTLLSFITKYISKTEDYEKTYVLATTDSMTGLYNHRFFQEHMQTSIERADRFNQKFSLILVDIDHFKRFNDTHGHQAGDEVLRQVAAKLKDSVRTIDIVVRYGGEEMAVILDRANEEEALTIANKLVTEIAAETYLIAKNKYEAITLSAGVGTYPVHGKTADELIEFADQGLYRAKEAGRNQVGKQYDE